MTDTSFELLEMIGRKDKIISDLIKQNEDHIKYAKKLRDMINDDIILGYNTRRTIIEYIDKHLLEIPT